MTVRAKVALIAARAQLAAARPAVERALAKVHYAHQLDPLPAGALDLVQDLETLQRSLERVEGQLGIFIGGRGVPA